MEKCPFCAEEIQDDAIKCRYCGEFLVKKPEPERKGDYDWEKLTEGNKIYNLLYMERNKYGKEIFKKQLIYAKNQAEAEGKAKKIYLAENRRLLRFEEIWQTEIWQTGKFSCPKCGKKYTDCTKKPGCFFWIIGILTLGLLLAILWPLLPYHCHCKFCGYDWKT